MLRISGCRSNQELEVAQAEIETRNAALLQARDQADAANRAQSQFLAGLRNPTSPDWSAS
jgi:hypothetical protein